jgi:hypothetical protein
MIHVRVRQENRIDFPRIEGEGIAIECLDRARPLEETAVNKDTPAAERHFEARTGDSPGGTVDSERWGNHASTGSASVSL